MKLYQCEKGREYQIENIQLSGQMAKRLEVLGLTPQTSVLVVNKKRCGSMIIKVRGARLAVGRGIGEGIEVTPFCPGNSLSSETEKKDGSYGR